jgi:hypothetical protein
MRAFHRAAIIGGPKIGARTSAVIPGAPASAFTRVSDALWAANPESSSKGKSLHFWIPGSLASASAPE